jgi:putative ABC transport system permease protein
MNILEGIRIALGSLWANKLRSMLTVLGVVIGVAAVIAVVTFVNGINRYVAEKVFNLGADVFLVDKAPVPPLTIEDIELGKKRKEFTMDDYQYVAENCRSCKYVGAAVYTLNGHINYSGQTSSDTFVRGWTPSMANIYALELVQGRLMTQSEQNSGAHVTIIGHDILDNMVKDVDPIGKQIRIDGQLFTIIGVGKKEGKTLGQSRDNWVMIPISTWIRLYGAHNNNLRIWGKGYGVGLPMENAIDEVRVLLRARRHDRVGQPDTFVIDTNQTFLGLWAAISANIFAVAIALASISLIVGGIVIMNMMLVSVTERTREIGVRKALGAKRADVLLQFLIESSMMALVGGLFGIALGIAVAEGVTFLIGMPSSIELWAVIAGMVVATSVGVFFGVYPARRAAELDPIVALRFEL